MPEPMGLVEMMEKWPAAKVGKAGAPPVTVAAATVAACQAEGVRGTRE